MHADYSDITARIDLEPLWYDTRGVPRYCQFRPELTGAASEVALVHAFCRICRREFPIAVSANGLFRTLPNLISFFSSAQVGYPPYHSCDALGLDVIETAVLEFWTRYREGKRVEWYRDPNWEVRLINQEDDELSIAEQIASSKRSEEFWDSAKNQDTPKVIEILEDFKCSQPNEVAQMIIATCLEAQAKNAMLDLANRP